MPTQTKPLPPMPAPNVVLIEPTTGKPTKAGYELLKALRDIAAALRLEIP